MLTASGLTDVTETATFCKLDDNKRPTLVEYPLAIGETQLCSDDLSVAATVVTDANPAEWYVRVMFDELLNPDVEDLIPNLDANGQPDGTSNGSLLNTQPVTVTCNGVAVAYDGYYAPEGNNLTWPVGPSLFIQPDNTAVPTGATCTITVKSNVLDKDGNQVPSNEIGPYMWQVAPLTFEGSTPGQPDDPTMPDVQDVQAPAQIQFNAFINAASLAPATVVINKVMACGGAIVTANIVPDIEPDDDPTTIVDISDSTAAPNAWASNSTYEITFVAATIQDSAGGTGDLPAAADLTICFATGT